MTNKEKAIADFIEYVKALDTDQLAYVIDATYYTNLCCEYCIYSGDNGDCRTVTGTCHNGIKKWLEQGE